MKQKKQHDPFAGLRSPDYGGRSHELAAEWKRRNGQITTDEQLQECIDYIVLQLRMEKGK